MKTKSHLLLAGTLVTAFLTTDSSAVQNEKTALFVGAAYSSLETPFSDADLAGGTGIFQLHLGELLLFDTSLRASYTYLKSTDSTDFERQDSDLDVIFSASALGLFTPYGILGISYDKFDAVSYSKNSDYEAGLGLGAGVEIALIPGLLSISPYGRYVNSDELETITYAVDVQLHFTALSAGVIAAYEENRSREGNLTTVTGYVGLRF